jgi:hypothetical protein
MRQIAAVITWTFAVGYCALVMFAFWSNGIVLAVLLGAGAVCLMAFDARLTFDELCHFISLAHAWAFGDFAAQSGENKDDVSTTELSQSSGEKAQQKVSVHSGSD